MSDKNIVTSLREIVQDLLVSKLKAVKGEVAALRTEMKISNDALRNDILLRLESSDRHTQQLIKALSDKLDFTIEVPERLASIEARMARQ